MARNGSGTMAVVNSFTSGAVTSAASMNANFSDFASEVSNSVAKDGQTSITAPIKFYAGTVAAPGITFVADPDSGFRRSAGDTMMAVTGGADLMEFGPSGATMQSGKTLTDQNAVVVVGMPPGFGPVPYVGTTAPTGWVRANGRTIGNASSGGTERANADTSSLFSVLWSAYANAQLAIQDSAGSASSRGADAATDYAANKRLPLPDLRGRAFFGLDDMGNSAASRLGSVITSQTTNGASGGAETVTVAQNQLPNITPTISITDPGHLHTVDSVSNAVNANAGATAHAQVSGTKSTASATTGITATSSSINGGVSQQALGNMPPAWLGTFIIKL